MLSAGPNNVTSKSQPNSLVPIHLSEGPSIAVTPEGFFAKTGVAVETFAPNVINIGDSITRILVDLVLYWGYQRAGCPTNS